MITVGVDLAAEPDRTGVAQIKWSEGGAALTHLRVGVDDDAVLASIRASDKTGIDAPLGWPEKFIEFLASQRTGDVVGPQNVAGRQWRRALAYRRTDEAVRATTGLVPLSVAADRIALTAMRAAALLSRLAAEGDPVDRTGAGIIVEVYPAASLKCWGLAHRGYKRPENLVSLHALVDALSREAPWLDLGALEETCRSSDHALDAVLAGLTARAAALHYTTEPSGQDAETARREGWIALPTRPLSALHN